MLWDDKAKQGVQSASSPSTGIAPIMSYGMMAARLPLSAGVYYGLWARSCMVFKNHLRKRLQTREQRHCMLGAQVTLHISDNEHHADLDSPMMKAGLLGWVVCNISKDICQSQLKYSVHKEELTMWD